jgi:autotransporter-associated beta strand protein
MKMKLNLLLNGSLALALVIAFGMSAQAQNLLSDPGFESGGVGSAWTTFNGANFSTNFAHSGSWSMENSGPGGFAVPGAFQTLATAAGDEYDLTGYGLAQAAPGAGASFGILQITFFSGPNGSGSNLGTIDVSNGNTPTGPGNAQLSNEINSSSPTGVWISFDTGIAEAPAGSESLAAYTLVVDQNPTTVYFDDLSLLQVPEPIWQAATGGSWKNAANWSSQTSPNGAGLQAVLGGSTTASCTITLDGGQTVGSLTFNNGTASYTLSAGSGGMLTLNNSGGTGSQIVVLAGTHSITAPVEIADGKMTVTESSHGRLTISGNISDDNSRESLTLNGDGSGVLVLSATNTYGGGTIVEDGKLVVTSPAALLDGSSLTVGANAASIPAPVVVARQSESASAAVPEPSTLGLLVAGAIGFMLPKRLRRGTRAAPTSTPLKP